MGCSVAFGSISSPRTYILFSSSAVKVHDSQAYRNMGMTRERISFTIGQNTVVSKIRLENPIFWLQITCWSI